MPKITAIVSAYYAEPYLKGRLENLLAQGMGDDLGVYVVCQKDSPESKIAVPFVNQFAHFVILTTENIPSVYEAWNLAIADSQENSEYIINANSDDLFCEGALLRMSQALDSHKGSAVVYANVDRTVEYGGKAEGHFEWLEGGLDELLNKGCFLGPMPMWRRSLHDKHGLFEAEMRSAGDYEFWMRIAAAGEKLLHIKGFICGMHLERMDALEHREPLRSVWEQARAKGKYRIIGEKGKPS